MEANEREDFEEVDENETGAGGDEEGADEIISIIIEGEEGASTEEEGGEEDDDTIVDEDGEKKPAPQWVKDLRKTNREQRKRIKELETVNTKKVEKKDDGQEEDEALKLGDKPTLEGCDFDSDVFEKKLSEWHETKRKVDEVAAKKETAAKAKKEAWQSTLNAYKTKKESLKVKGFEEAEEAFTSTMSETQQAVILVGAENPAAVVYALGKNKKLADELAKIKDPVKFSFAIAKLEATKLKMTSRKTETKPEKTVTGSTGSTKGAVDSTLEKLRAEAEKTGDYTKVHQYKMKKRQKK